METTLISIRLPATMKARLAEMAAAEAPLGMRC